MKTKLFNGYSPDKRTEGGYRVYEGVDNQINRFQEENPNIDIVDVKLAIQPDGDFGYLVALVLYK